MKIVLTGGPCSGKSSVIAELKKRGYNIVEEVARKLIQEGWNPRSQGEIHDFQCEIAKRQTELEKSVNGLTYFDRGLLDSLAYCELRLGYVPDNIYCEELRNRYDLVLILDRLPLENDGERFEKDDEEAEKIHRAIQEKYENYEYSLKRVPVFPNIEKRTDFILDYIQNQVKGGVD